MMRLLSNRYVIACIALALVLSTILITRAISGSTPPPIAIMPVPAPSATSDVPAPRGVTSSSPSPRDTSDDSLYVPTPTRAPRTPAAPLVSGGAAGLSGATALAQRFTRVWLAHSGPVAQWHADLDALATPDERPQLDQIDPANITATKITGPIRTTMAPDSFVTSVVPLDNGTMTLTLLADSGRWFVNQVDGS